MSTKKTPALRSAWALMLVVPLAALVPPGRPPRTTKLDAATLAPPRAARGAQTAADVARGAAPRPRVPAARGPRGRARPGGRAAAARAHARGVGRAANYSSEAALRADRARMRACRDELIARNLRLVLSVAGRVQAAARLEFDRPRRRGELRAGQGGGALRPRAGLPLLDVRGLVDPAGDLARRRPRTRARSACRRTCLTTSCGLCGINQCVGCTRQLFTTSFLGDEAAERL